MDPTCPYCYKNDKTRYGDNPIAVVSKSSTPKSLVVQYCDLAFCERCSMEFAVDRSKHQGQCDTSLCPGVPQCSCRCHKHAEAMEFAVDRSK